LSETVTIRTRRLSVDVAPLERRTDRTDRDDRTIPVRKINTLLSVAGAVRGARVVEFEQGAVQPDPGELPEPVAVPEQQREPSGERGVRRGRGRGRTGVRRRRPPSSAGHAAVGHENETETIEAVPLDGFGRRVAAAAAARLHRRQQPRTAAQGAPFHAEETVQHHAKQLPEEFTISQVSLPARFVRDRPAAPRTIIT